MPKMIEKRYSTVPPGIQNSHNDKPTLLVSWWCTIFAVTIILVRISGRKIRTNRLFPEDKVMALSMIPLLIRMGLVHMILLWGTNNTQTQGLTEMEIQHRETGSRLVLGSRIFYAMFIWTAKFTVSEFLKRLTGQFWRKAFEWGLRGIRIFLAVTFLAVFIATLAECQPFSHYWQVVPDPGPRCRQGYTQLITMGTCDIITDLLLVVFPIPIIVTSAMPTKRKVSLTLLFSLSLALVGITAYRVPAVIERRGSQQFRSLIASFEILAATAVSNAVVIGSFIRDRGVKKQKYRHNSVTSSLERTPTRRATITQHHWGSDADLVGDMGMRLDPNLQSRVNSNPRAPPMAQTASMSRIRTRDIPEIPEIPKDWTLASGARQDHDRDSLETDSIGAPDRKGDIKKSASAPAALDLKNGEPSPPPPQNTPGKMSFFDVGGLMESGTPPPPSSQQSSSPATTIHAQDFAIQIPSAQTSRRGSRALLSDVGGLLSSQVEVPSQCRTSHSSRTSQQPPPMVRNFSRGSTAYNGRLAGRRSNADENNSPTPPYRAEPDVTGPTQTGSESMSFVDVGGLLGGRA